VNDYRYNPFDNISTAVAITGETHVIPSASPYIIRLNEVPMKETPSSISLTIAGAAGNEVSAAPASGEFWPDYSTGADDDDSWNTGTILFNAADAGKTVVIAYTGTGTLVDTRTAHGQVVFTSSGSWTCQEGTTHIKVLLIGGGGGGQGTNGSTSLTSGQNGGDSSFGTLLTSAGGLGGKTTVSAAATITSSTVFPILKSSFMVGLPGAKGSSGTKVATSATGHGHSGGGSYQTVNTVYDGVSVNSSGNLGQATGGGCLYAVAVPVVGGDTYTVTIGAGGLGGDNTYDGGSGAPGLCIIWY